MPVPITQRAQLRPILTMTPSNEHVVPRRAPVRSDSAISDTSTVDNQSDGQEDNYDDDDFDGQIEEEEDDDDDDDPNRQEHASREGNDQAVSTSVPRPLGPRRRTVPSVAYPERLRPLGQLQPIPQNNSSSAPRLQRSNHGHPSHYHPHHRTAPSDSNDLDDKTQSPEHEPPLEEPPLSEQRSDPTLPRPACSICGDEAPRAYGLLQNCDHAFCVTCLRQWRQQGTTSDQDELTSNFKCCPLCRTQSLICVRSPDFLTGQAKSDRIDAAMAPKKGIPCRYFTKSLRSSQGPFCPFGDECFYLHQMGPGQFRFGLGAEQMQDKSSARRRVAAYRSYPPSEDEASDTESISSHTSSTAAARPTTLRRFGSIGRARTRFGGSGLGLTPMAGSPAMMMSFSASESPRDGGSPHGGDSPVPVLHAGSAAAPRRASFGGAGALGGRSPGSNSPSLVGGSGTKERRGSIAAAAAAARRQREARASMSSSRPSPAPTPPPPPPPTTTTQTTETTLNNRRSSFGMRSGSRSTSDSPSSSSPLAGSGAKERRGSIAAAAAAARRQREARASMSSSGSAPLSRLPSGLAPVSPVRPDSPTRTTNGSSTVDSEDPRLLVRSMQAPSMTLMSSSAIDSASSSPVSSRAASPMLSSRAH